MQKKSFLLVFAGLLILILLRLIPFLFPESRTWGFNHLIFLPSSYSVAFFILVAIALIIPFLKSSEKMGEDLSEWFSFTFFGSRLKYLYRSIFIAIMTALFIIFATPTHFLGDGYDVINNIANSESVHVKWSEVGITKILNAILLLLGTNDIYSSRLLFQIISIVSGVFSLFFYFNITEIITGDRFSRILIFVLSICSGSLLLFFGYAEYYPVLWIMLTGHIYFSLKYLKTKRGIISLWLFLLVGIFMHLQMILFLPAALYVSLVGRKGLSLFLSYKKIILGTLISLLVVVASIVIYKYVTDLYIEDIFLTLFIGKPINPGYAVFSLPHLLDIFNETVLVSPFLLLLILLSEIKIRNISKLVISKYLILASSCSLFFLFIIDPKLGMPRDWDLFAMTIFPLSLFLAVNLYKQIESVLKKLLIPIILFSIISVLPFLITNLSKEESVNYLKYMINLDREKSLSSFVILSSYYKDNNNSLSLDSLNKMQNQMYPDKYKSDLAIRAINNGDFETAAEFIDEIKPDRFNPNYHLVLSKYFFLINNYNQAHFHIDKAIELRRYAGRYYLDRARIFIAVGKYDKALADLKHGLELDPSNMTIIEGLAYLHNEMGNYDLSINNSKRLLEIDSLIPVAYYWIARGYLKKSETFNAERYADRYFEFELSDSVFILYSNELRVMLGQFEETPK